jgi:hypothetical protein
VIEILNGVKIKYTTRIVSVCSFLNILSMLDRGAGVDSGYGSGSIEKNKFPAPATPVSSFKSYEEKIS